MTCRDGHPPRHPDFTEGNVVALKHGAGSPRVVDPLAAELVADALTAVPDLERPEYRATVEAWAREEARCRLLSAWLNQHGLMDDEGRLRPAEQALHRAETRATNLRSRLGLDPLSTARLGRDKAQARAMSMALLMASVGDEEGSS
jgi:hypothetical protein